MTNNVVTYSAIATQSTSDKSRHGWALYQFIPMCEAKHNRK